MAPTYDAERDVPTLETDRLVLRGPRLEDFTDCAAMWADPEVTRHIGGRPSSPEVVWARVLRYIGHWAALGFGFWLVRDRTSDRFVGEVGFAHFKRTVQPSFGDTPEIGWVLARWAQGRGLGTEAVSAALAWHEQRYGRVRTVCLIEPANVASLRLASRCGYQEYQRTIYEGSAAILLER